MLHKLSYLAEFENIKNNVLFDMRMLHVVYLVYKITQGLQSANPHNDYCQHFVETGERPQNFIRDVGMFIIYM